MALSADSMRKVQLLLSKSVGVETALSAMSEVMRKIEINTKIAVDDKLDDNQRQVLDYFMMKTNPQKNLEMSIKLRHPMTGTWLTGPAGFATWLQNPGSKMWLSGIPGAGKTVLAGSVIQEAVGRSYTADDIGVGFFFDDYKSEITWDPVNVLGAVASQLARQKPGAFDILKGYYDQLHPRKGLEKTPDPDDLRAMIGEMSELFAQTIIVVDGLDECGETTSRVVDGLQELATFHSKVSMALFSRNHDEIRSILESEFDHIEIAAHTDDVKLYVGAELDHRIQTRRLRLSNMAIKDEIAEKLVERANGM